MAEVFGNRFDS